jgi:hypothetical protein
MLKRLKITAGAVGAFAALALGGAALAGATSGGTPTQGPAPVAATEVTTGPDVGANIQSGDQNTPDTASASTSAAAPADGTADTPESATSESSTSETATPSDGPGGWADASPNADTQQQGEN